MPEKRTIYEFCHSLSLQERKYISRKLSDEKKRLFQLLQKQKRYDGEYLAQQFKGFSVKELSTLKQDLLRTMAVLSTEFRRKLNPSHTLQLVQDEAMAYMEKGFHAEAIRNFQKAISIATDHAEYRRALELVESCRECLIAKGRQKEDFKLEALLAEKERSLDTVISEIDAVKKWHREAGEIKRMADDMRKSRAIDLLSQLPKLANCNSISSMIYVAQAKTKCLFYLDRRAEAVSLLEESLDRVEKGRKRASVDELRGFVRYAVANLCYMRLSLKNYAGARSVFQTYGHLIKDQGLDEDPTLGGRALFCDLFISIEQNEFPLFCSVLERLKDRQAHRDVVEANVLYFEAARGCMLFGIHAKALHWVGRVHSLKAHFVAPHWPIMAHALEILTYIDLGDWEGLGYARRRAEYYYNSRSCWSEYEYALIKCVDGITHDPDSLASQLAWLKESLSALQSLPELRRRFLLFPIFNWLAAKGH